MTFKFLRFPVLVQRAILQNMDIFEVLVLLMMNKTVRRTLNAYKYRIDDWNWTDTDSIRMWIRGKSVQIKLLPDRRGKELGVFSLKMNQKKFVVRIAKPKIDELDSEEESEEEPEEEPEEELEEEPKEEREEELETMFFIEHATENDNSDQSKLRLNKLISCYLLNFITPASFGLYWNADEVSPDNLFIFDLTKTFRFVGIEASVSAETIKMLMEEITTTVHMHLSIQCTTENFKYQNKSNEVSKIKHLYIWNSDFVQFENFIKYLNSPSLRCPVPSSKTMNSILKEWIGGENNVIEFLRLFEFGNLNKQHILEGIDYTRTRFKRKELISLFGSESAFSSYRNLSFDIKRTFDNRVATIVILKEELRVYVWTDEHMLKIRNIL